MKSKIFLSGLVLFLFFAQIAQAQEITTRGRLTNSTYVFEQEDSDGAENTHIRLYQLFRFRAKAADWNNLSLNIAARALTDLEEDLDSDRRFNAYRLSVSADRLFHGFVDFELGRQFFHPGITLGAIDGLNLTLHPLKGLSWQLYGGVESNLFKSFDVYEFKDAAVFGSTVKYTNWYNTDIQLAFLQKQTDSETQWQIAGLNLSNYLLEAWQFWLQGHYDIENSRLHRLYVSTRFEPTSDLRFNLSYKMQHPQVYANSLFSIFEFDHYQQTEFSAAYLLNENMALTAKYQFVQLEEGSGNRIFAGLTERNGSLFLVFETGDLGDQLGIMVNYGYEVLPDVLLSASIDYLRYRFSELYEYDNQLANALRLSYLFSENWRTDLEYQWLNNRQKDSDQRILNHIHFIW